MEGFLTCKNCNSKYDSDRKMPIVLGCGHSCCKECYLSSYEPQDNKVKCPIDNKMFDAPSDIPINVIVLELIKTQIKGPAVFCFEHEHKEVEFYCRKHNELLCSLCVWEHSDHRALVKVCTQKQIKDHTSELRSSLNKMNEEIVGKIEKGLSILNDIENKDKQVSSKQIMDGFDLCKQILIQPFFSEDGEGKKLKYIIDLKDNFLEGSQLVNSDEKKMIKEYTGLTIAVTDICYRATKDGFQASTFHSKVDTVGAVIVLIKSKNGQVFGGYTQMGFDSSSTYKVDLKAFLFHVSKKKKIEQTGTYQNQVYGAPSYHATFGGGHDLYLCDNCNTTNSSYSNFGHTYKCPDGIAYGATEAQNYFAGSYNFMVDEVEVFKFIVAE